MKLCSKCDTRATCCDFCTHYDFNGDQLGRYTDDGYCKLHKRRSEPEYVCDDFHCEHAKED